MSEKTKRLLDDYEKLKFESENLKAENIKLKDFHHHHKESVYHYHNSNLQNSLNSG